ncbi:hypothetical protein ACIRSU_20420 [Streptomyces sp. NPDC101160]|uniref:hypothetical protein n=1 Tax=Streptomyces sp. NPDC101160 TaxID=3366118 RepID=UPI003806240B
MLATLTTGAGVVTLRGPKRWFEQKKAYEENGDAREKGDLCTDMLRVIRRF